MIRCILIGALPCVTLSPLFDRVDCTVIMNVQCFCRTSSEPMDNIVQPLNSSRPPTLSSRSDCD